MEHELETHPRNQIDTFYTHAYGLIYLNNPAADNNLSVTFKLSYCQINYHKEDKKKLI